MNQDIQRTSVIYILFENTYQESRKTHYVVEE